MTRSRTLAREIALQRLYQQDLGGEGGPDPSEGVAGADAEALEYARALVEGVRSRDAELTEALRGLVEHWSWDRVAAVDRSILRIGAYELLHAPEVPPKVALDEAIELAKRYSTRESGAFVNGILDRLYRRIQAAS